MAKIKSATIAERSMATNQLVEVLRVGSDELLYSVLDAAVNGNVRKSHAQALHSARRIVRKEYQIEYMTVRNIGLRRMTAKDAPIVGMQSITKMHREAKRGLDKVGCAGDISKLSNEDRTKLNATISGLGAIAVVTQSRSMKKLESAVEKKSSQLALADTLKEFSR